MRVYRCVNKSSKPCQNAVDNITLAAKDVPRPPHCPKCNWEMEEIEIPGPVKPTPPKSPDPKPVLKKQHLLIGSCVLLGAAALFWILHSSPVSQRGADGGKPIPPDAVVVSPSPSPSPTPTPEVDTPRKVSPVEPVPPPVVPPFKTPSTLAGKFNWFASSNNTSSKFAETVEEKILAELPSNTIVQVVGPSGTVVDHCSIEKYVTKLRILKKINISIYENKLTDSEPIIKVQETHSTNK